jgi:hypothetical protein
MEMKAKETMGFGCTVTEAAKDDSRTADLELLCHSLSSTFSLVTDNTSQCRRPGRRQLPF